MSNRVVLLPTVLCLLLVTCGACFAMPAVGTKAPDFTLSTSTGGTFKLSTYSTTQPKVVLLDFWASWCGPCKSEIPYLIQINNDYKNKGVLVVGVTGDSPVTTGYNWATANGVNYTVCGDDNFGVTSGPYGIDAIPMTFIVDRTGTIQLADRGFGGDGSDMRAKVDQLVPEPSSVMALITGIIGLGGAGLRKRRS